MLFIFTLRKWTFQTEQYTLNKFSKKGMMVKYWLEIYFFPGIKGLWRFFILFYNITWTWKGQEVHMYDVTRLSVLWTITDLILERLAAGTTITHSLRSGLWFKPKIRDDVIFKAKDERWGRNWFWTDGLHTVTSIKIRRRMREYIILYLYKFKKVPGTKII